ncbi:MAG: hypothetical protein ACREBF_03545 [Candidatus Micrarchaeales archaeon]
MKHTRFDGKDEALKRKAIWMLNLIKASEYIDYFEAISSDIARIKAYDQEAQVNALLTLSARVRSEEGRSCTECMRALLDYSDKKESGARLAIEPAISLLSTLNKYNKKVEKSLINAQITFDPSILLTFGDYGSSGKGNCQKSTRLDGLNQSIMSMVVDANQFMIMFTKADGDKPIGLMQLHLLESQEKGPLFLLEKPYTNEPNKESGMKEAAKLLALKIKVQTGIDCYTYGEEGQKISVKVPKSYVERYIDFIGNLIGESEQYHELFISNITAIYDLKR